MKPYVKNLGKVRPTAEGEHDNRKEYDILSIVTVGGSSYLSRTYVPKGIDIENEIYWQLLCAGSFNPTLCVHVFDGGRADTLYGGARVVDCGNANNNFKNK